MERFLEQMDFTEGLAASVSEKAAKTQRINERLVGFMKGFMNWTPAKRVAFLEEAGAETISDFTFLFAYTLDRMLLPKYKSQTPDWRNYVRTGTNRDFRPSQGIGTWGLRGALDQKTLRGEYKERVISDGKVEISVNPFGNRFSIGWENFVNDDLGALADVAGDFVQAAMRTEWREVTKLFSSATGPNSKLFGAPIAHPVDSKNVTNLGSLTFNADNLGKVFTAMRSQKDADGEPIIVTKFHVVVPPALEVQMLQALNTAALIAVGLSATNAKEVQTSANVVAQNFSVSGYVNPYLPVVDASAGASKTWYVFADPQQDGPAVKMHFLAGREAPEVVMKASNKVSLGGGAVPALEGDYETDKVGFRARHILGGAAVDPRFAYAEVGS